MNKLFDVKQSVKQRYGAIASDVLELRESQSCCSGKKKDPITSDHYNALQADAIPEEALLASLGCGNPTALAELHEGEVVLDLGSGGGIDVLLSAKRVGTTGKAYGLDMTDEMLALARQNQEKAGVTNVEFLKGEIENIPLPDNSVDVIISNCVINLSGDKDAVFAEAFRVLKPGGRFAVADIVSKDEIPDEVRSQVDFWTGCVSGALQDNDYISRMEIAGFVDVSIQPVRTYTADDAKEFVTSDDACCSNVAEALAASVYSGFIRARKP